MTVSGLVIIIGAVASAVYVNDTVTFTATLTNAVEEDTLVRFSVAEQARELSIVAGELSVSTQHTASVADSLVGEISSVDNPNVTIGTSTVSVQVQEKPSVMGAIYWNGVLVARLEG